MGRRILIGGSSLAGKSSLAAKLSEELGWETVATDYLARHPGRPWRADGSQVPPHVVEHFLSLAPEELLEDVLRHYRSLTPRICELVENGPEHLILEGSAVLPELAFGFGSKAQSCFLIAEPDVLSTRILQHAGRENEAARKFAERAELMNGFVHAEAKRLGLPTFDAEFTSTEIVMTSLEIA